MCYIQTKVHFVIKKKISPNNEQTHFFVFTQINFYFNRPKYLCCRSVQTDAYLLLYSYMVFFCDKSSNEIDENGDELDLFTSKLCENS